MSVGLLTPLAISVIATSHHAAHQGRHVVLVSGIHISLGPNTCLFCLGAHQVCQWIEETTYLTAWFSLEVSVVSISCYHNTIFLGTATKHPLHNLADGACLVDGLPKPSAPLKAWPRTCFASRSRQTLSAPSSAEAPFRISRIIRLGGWGLGVWVRDEKEP